MAGVCVNDVPSAIPLPLSVNVPDVAAAVPVHVPFVNHLNVTVPVGVPEEPVTVAWSCTIVPAPTDVTTECAALWIAVTVVVSVLMILFTKVHTTAPPVGGTVIVAFLFATSTVAPGQSIESSAQPVGRLVSVAT